MELSDRQLSNMIDEMQTLGSRLRSNTDALEMKASQDRGLKDGLDEFNFHIRNQNQEISKLTEGLKTLTEAIIEINNASSYQNFTNSLIQLSIAQKLGTLTPDLCKKLTVDCYNNNKDCFQFWTQSQRENASALIKQIGAQNEVLSAKEETTRE